MSIIAYEKAGKRAYRAKVKFRNQQFTKAGFPTKEKAREWMLATRRALKKEAEQPQTATTRDLTYSGISAAYLEDSKARQQPGTFVEKARHLTEFIEFLGRDIAVQSIKPEHGREFVSHIQKTGTNKTANRYLRTLKALWNWSARRYLMPPNPFNVIEPYPEDTALRYIPPTENVVAVLTVAQEWERDFLNVLVKTGARPGEVRTLNWQDVDFSRGTITLWTRKRKHGQREPRTLNMSDQLAECLKRRFEQRRDEIWVFVNEETGKPFTRQSRPYKFLMERLCERANAVRAERNPDATPITPFTFYAFRHFVATRLRDSGKASKFEIQHLLGHQRSDTTDIYLRSLAPDIKEAVSALDDVVDMDKLDEGKPEKRKVISISRG